MYTRVPTYNDLSSYCSNAGVTLPDQTFCQDLLDSVSEEWNDLVGYTFVNSGISTTKYDYPSNSGQLWLPEYYSNINTISLNGSVLTANTDYWVKGRLITFNAGSLYFPAPNCVSISGYIGYTQVPTSAWRVMLDYAIYKIIYANPQRTFTSSKQGDVEIKFGPPIDTPKKFEDISFNYKY